MLLIMYNFKTAIDGHRFQGLILGSPMTAQIEVL